MQQSQSIKNLAAALKLFHVKMDTVKKDSRNPFFNSKYASLSNILEAIKIPLDESGLIFSQLPEGQNGLCSMLMHSESGEFISATYEMRPVKDDPQGRGSAITYQRRYALAAILGLNIDDDDDANKASGLTEKGHPDGAPAPTRNQQGEVVNKPWLNKGTKEFTGAVKKLREGTTTIDNIKKVMRLSKEVEQLLKDEMQKVA